MCLAEGTSWAGGLSQITSDRMEAVCRAQYPRGLWHCSSERDRIWPWRTFALGPESGGASVRIKCNVMNRRAEIVTQL